MDIVKTLASLARRVDAKQYARLSHMRPPAVVRREPKEMRDELVSQPYATTTKTVTTRRFVTDSTACVDQLVLIVHAPLEHCAVRANIGQYVLVHLVCLETLMNKAA